MFVIWAPTVATVLPIPEAGTLEIVGGDTGGDWVVNVAELLAQLVPAEFVA